MSAFRTIIIFVSLVINLSQQSVIKRAAPSFDNGSVLGNISASNIVEASGIAASHVNPGFVYTHNDHGGQAEIFVLSSTGHLAATITLTGVTDNDWEDIAVGPCDHPSTQTCIYIGDTGDDGNGSVNNIFRFPEPATIQDQTIHLTSANKLEFSWNQVDCNTLMVDPEANMYIISRVDGGHGTIFKIPNTAWGSNTRVNITSSAVLPISTSDKDPVGGDISPDGNEILIKARNAVYFWSTGGSRDYLSILQTHGVTLPYIHEHKGEAVCWDPKGQGYYTIGEGHKVPLYYYARHDTAVVG